MFISTCMQTHLQGTVGGGWRHLLAFSKVLIKGMAEHTEGMEKRAREKNNSWGLAKAECRYHKFMSARFEALPRQCDDAKWLVLLPCVFLPVYLRAQCCCFSVCMHACVILSVSAPPPFSSLFRGMNTGWLCECSCLCQTPTQNLGETVKIEKVDSLIVLLFSETGKLENRKLLSICSIFREHLKTIVSYVHIP